MARALAESNEPRPIVEERELWQARMLSLLQPEEEFRAGVPHERVALWKWLFAKTRTSGRQKDMVLKLLCDGYKFPFVGTAEHLHKTQPKHRRKREQVINMLTKAGPKEGAPNMMTGVTPSEAYFPNHQSVLLEPGKALFKAEVEAGLKANILVEWPEGTRPWVVNPMSMLTKEVAAGKLKHRLLIDPRYINLFMEHCPVVYETLRDLAYTLWPGDLLMVFDDKSGFNHIPIHPEHWGYLGVECEGRYFAYTHLPFGVAPGPMVYTMVKQQMYAPLRALGVRLAFLIDDTCAAEVTEERARRLCEVLLLIMTALGFNVGIKKSDFVPGHCKRFLGMMVDALKQTFAVPLDKVVAFKELLAERRAQLHITPMQIAQVAGKMVAMSVAVPLAMTLARSIAKAIRMDAVNKNWKALWPKEDAMMEDWDIFEQLLTHHNGLKHWPAVSHSTS